MNIYNVTVNIDPSVHEEWLAWMKTKHIPDVMNTGMFTEYKMCRMLGTDEEEGFTYVLQYTCKSMELFEQYKADFAPALQSEYNKKFEGKYVAYRSLMEVIL